MSNSADSPNSNENQGKKLSSGNQLQPIEVSGITAVTLGTYVWFVAFALALLFNSRLTHAGHGDWKWVALAGVVLGVLGQVYTRRRAKRLGLIN